MTRTLPRRAVLAATTATATAALAGCLGGSEGDDPEELPSTEPDEDAGELGTPAESVTVTITSEPWPEFDPQIVHVEVGATVEWLVETGRHDVTGYHENNHPPHRTPDGVEAWDSEYLTGPGSSYERTFEVEGVYDYVDRQQVCISHEVAGNVGRVVVGWPDPDEEPAMQPLTEAESEEVPERVENAFEQFDERTRPVLEAGPA
ncbi:halocyanin [Natronomonas sp. F2-12]|jgi:plastocyanin|uniref:Halocyanin n=1 Tax=Natronomonas aquatica TaxID=2841590 RepID=A0A9R1D6E6_9EURY|nr:plastocyanin/azurin family copper-binding protein [Natronomonas aquatica]MCQ4332962.1 halocyanin [Natronomonas aquatica]